MEQSPPPTSSHPPRPQVGSLVLHVYNPGASADVPVRAFEARWVQQVGRGTGADGYSFCYADLDAVHTPFGEMGVGDGLVVRFRTHGFFQGRTWCSPTPCTLH